jgi:hypothetical protein
LINWRRVRKAFGTRGLAALRTGSRSIRQHIRDGPDMATCRTMEQNCAVHRDLLRPLVVLRRPSASRAMSQPESSEPCERRRSEDGSLRFDACNSRILRLSCLARVYGCQQGLRICQLVGALKLQTPGLRSPLPRPCLAEFRLPVALHCLMGKDKRCCPPVQPGTAALLGTDPDCKLLEQKRAETLGCARFCAVHRVKQSCWREWHHIEMGSRELRTLCQPPGYLAQLQMSVDHLADANFPYRRV